MACLGLLVAACATAGAGNDPPLPVPDDAGSSAVTDEASSPPTEWPDAGPSSSGATSGGTGGSGAPTSGAGSASMCPMDVLHGLAALFAIGQPACASTGCDAGECCYVNMSSSASVCVKQ